MLLQSVLEVNSSEVVLPQLYQDGGELQSMADQLQTTCNGLPSKLLQMLIVPFACSTTLISLLKAKFAHSHRQEKEFARVRLLILM